jgi:uncharacterized caspase-like protein
MPQGDSMGFRRRLRRAYSIAGALCALAAIAPACSTGTTRSAEGIRAALVVGNADYKMFAKLDNPTNDMSDVCAALERVGFTTTCLGDVADKREFLALVDKFAASLDSKSVSVFYYSGHAVQVNGENYLIPARAHIGKASDIRTEFIGLNEIFSRFGRYTGRFQMIVLDACRNDPFTPDEQRKGRGFRDSGLSAESRFVLTRAMADSQMKYGLTAIKEAPAGTIVLYATASDHMAFDGEGRNGTLTKHFLRHVETRGLEVDTLVRRIMDGVQRETQEILGEPQTPYVYSSFSGDFCFSCKREVVFPPAY